MWFRVLLGWLLPPQMSFLKASHTKETREASIRKQVYQDVCFPACKLKEVLSVSDRLFNIYPLMIYPCKIFQRGGMLRANYGDGEEGAKVQMNLNLGIYGVPAESMTMPMFPTVTRVRKLEPKHTAPV